MKKLTAAVVIAIIACLVCLGAAAQGDQSPAPQTQSEQATGKVYMVQPGDTLPLIARKLQLSLNNLVQANSLDKHAPLFAGQYLSLPEEAEKPQPKSYVVRRGDSLSRIAQRHGTSAQALAQANGLRLRTVIHPGQKLILSTKAEAVSARVEQVAPKDFVASAMQYRGVRYRYGGTTTRGMDCSGLVSRVLNNHGVKAPHNSRALYHLGKAIAKANFQANDLVFFNTRGRGISHVGIYIGDGKFIHASSGQGRVRVDTLTEGYYSRRYVGARRVG